MRFNLNLEDIKYTKILYRNEEGNPCTVKAAIKQVNDREILSCTKFLDEFQIETPQDVILSIICNDGLYRTKTKLKSVTQEEPYTFFALETPQGLEYQQNREYFRVSLDYECTYIVEGREFKAKTFDISANGISILMPMHIISENDCIIILTIDRRTIELNAKYIRSEKLSEGHKISFTYTKIKETDRDYISQICIKKQLEQKRNAII